MEASSHEPDRSQLRLFTGAAIPASDGSLLPTTQSEPEQAALVGLRELGSLLLSTDFKQDFVEAQVAEAVRAKDILERRIFQKLIFPQIVKAVEAEGTVSGRKEAKRIAASRSTLVLDGREFNLERPLDVITLRHSMLGNNAHYATLFDEAVQASETTRSEAHTVASSLIEEFRNLKDPASLLSALELWGRSRNAAGDRNGGAGYHAGVIHYFEYRTVAEKNKRFLNNRFSKCSIQDFIEVSESFRPFIRDSAQDAARRAHSYIAINDGADKRRVFIRTDEALLIAFQHSGQPLRLLSFIPNKAGLQKREDTLARIEKELAAEGLDTRFNQLGSKRALEAHFAPRSPTQPQE